MESGVWSHSGVWWLKSGVTPESEIWSLQLLRSQEAGIWSHSGIWSLESGVWNLESLRSLVAEV